jgi:hypothetical protein
MPDAALSKQENEYPACTACTCIRFNCEASQCFRDGGKEGFTDCINAWTCQPSSDANYPFKSVGIRNTKGTCMVCQTGDDGVDATMESFAVSVDMPEGEDLCACLYCICFNYSCYTKFPDNCNGGSCEVEACMLFCTRARMEAEYTMCPCFSCCRISGSGAACDFQRPKTGHDDEDVVVNCAVVGEYLCCCECKGLISAVWKNFLDPCFCLQVRSQLLCLVVQAAFPPTKDVPMACAACGTYCFGEEAVMAVSDEKPSMKPNSST